MPWTGPDAGGEEAVGGATRTKAGAGGDVEDASRDEYNVSQARAGGRRERARSTAHAKKSGRADGRLSCLSWHGRGIGHGQEMTPAVRSHSQIFARYGSGPQALGAGQAAPFLAMFADANPSRLLSSGHGQHRLPLPHTHPRRPPL